MERKDENIVIGDESMEGAESLMYSETPRMGVRRLNTADDIKRKYGVHMGEYIKPSTIESKARYLCSRLSKRFGVLKYLTYGPSAHKRLSWVWVNKNGNVPCGDPSATRLIVNMLEERFGGDKVEIPIESIPQSQNYEYLCLAAFARIAAKWCIVGTNDLQSHEGRVEYWDSLVRMELGIFGIHDAYVSQLTDQMADVWNRVSLMEVEIKELMRDPNSFNRDDKRTGVYHQMMKVTEEERRSTGIDHFQNLEHLLIDLIGSGELNANMIRQLKMELSYMMNVRVRRDRALKDLAEYTAPVDWRSQRVAVVDIEAWERDRSKILEVGFTLCTRSGIVVGVPRHFIIKENVKLRNGQFVKDNRAWFVHGTSEVITQVEFVKFFGEHDINVSGWVFHDAGSDLRFLYGMGLFPQKPVYDTQVFVDIMPWVDDKSKGLGFLARKFGFMAVSEHNAGNDAVVTQQILRKVCEYYKEFYAGPELNLGSGIVEKKEKKGTVIRRKKKKMLNSADLEVVTPPIQEGQSDGFVVEANYHEIVCLSCRKPFLLHSFVLTPEGNGPTFCQACIVQGFSKLL